MKTFLSSTFVDLKDHRRAAAEALERLGQQVGRMEVFGARPDEPTAACLSEVEACDLFVGIYAHRYGFIPPGRDISVTEEEFNHARRNHKPIFGFLIHDDHPWPPRLVEGEPGHTKLLAFKQRLGDHLIRDVFTTPEDLAFKVAAAVGRYLARGHLDNLTSRFRRSMGEAGLDAQSLARGRTLSDVSESTRAHLERLLSELQETIGRLTAEHSVQVAPADADALLALAQGLMAEKNWFEAGKEFEKYAMLRPEDWEAAYLRGVSFVNSRNSAETDLSALRAYNDAIAFAPSGIDPNMCARLFAYRGAVFKRLGRLDEAEWDLLFAKARATKEYEVNDIKYNLAGVYAMRGEREKLLALVRELKQSQRHLAAIRTHFDDYFRLYVNDRELLEAIGSV
jgi:Flp pilus assembly protein TadD